MDVIERLKQQVEIRGTASPFGNLAAAALLEIERLHALVDIGYDHLLNCGYKEEDPTLTQLRTGLTPNAALTGAEGVRVEGTVMQQTGD